MARKLKLVVAVVVLGGLIAFLARPGPEAGEVSALVPGSSSPAASPQSEEELASVESEPLAILEPPLAPPDEPAPAAEAARSSPALPPVPLPPLVIERTFELAYLFEADPDLPLLVELPDDVQQLNFDGEVRLTIKVEDTYPPSVPGEPRDFDRYLTADWSWVMPVGFSTDVETPEANHGASPLSGRTLLFRWGPDLGTYSVSLESPRPEDEAHGLERLDADMDLRAFCPPPGAGAGLQWTLPLDGVRGILSPGGDLSYAASGDEGGAATELWARYFTEDSEDARADRKTVTSLGVSGVGNSAVHELQVELQLSRVVDVPEHPGGARAGGSAEATPLGGEVEITFEAEGRGRWSESGQRVSELELVGTLRARAELLGDLTRLALESTLKSLRHGRVRIVLRAEAHHLHQEGDQVQPLLREAVAELRPVLRIGLLVDDVFDLEASEAVREDVGRDALAGVQELAVARQPAQGHVADEQQGPAVAEEVEGEDDRTGGARVGGRHGSRSLGHGLAKSKSTTCTMQVHCITCCAPEDPNEDNP